ncbi:copper resistance protein NlpE N-terminal domain-containing protein [Vibrio sp. YIC-376]|uniref:copper resistance protein NlpE N-terminal domain-containing protein n=1 Tax=Vibrio sp. YIC-376 TaxID=3136162 RepID=UPI00402AD1C8
MIKYSSIIVLALAFGTGCVDKNLPNSEPEQTLEVSQKTIVTNTNYNARDSIDWNGIYKGIVPCEDCSATHLLVELKNDGHYSLGRSYFDKMSATVMEEGGINWNEAGSILQIGEYRFLVEENKLFLVDQDEKSKMDGKGKPYVLNKEIW